MLVLSRRLNERILFPDFQASVQVVGVKNGQVRLGIDAPSKVKVLREEVQARAALWGGNEPQFAVEWGGSEPPRGDQSLASKVRELNHLLRNGLNGASIGFALLGRQLQAGLTQDAEATLAKIDKDFQVLRQKMEGEVEKTQPPPVPKLRPSKALLVEDNPNERELLATFLRLGDVEVDTAGDGADALDYLRARGRPDVVLLDMSLPRCDGPTMVREIRRDPAYAGLKIFAVTGHQPEEYDVAIGPEGIDRWFRKPLDPAAFLLDLSKELNLSLGVL